MPENWVTSIPLLDWGHYRVRRKSSNFPHRWRWRTILSYLIFYLFNGYVSDWNDISSMFLLSLQPSTRSVLPSGWTQFLWPIFGQNWKWNILPSLTFQFEREADGTWAASAPCTTIHWLGSLSRPTVITRTTPPLQKKRRPPMHPFLWHIAL